MKEGIMKSLFKKLLLISSISTPYATTQPILAAPKSAAKDQQQVQLVKIQAYLNGIGTLRANFSQNNPDGTTVFGKMYLKRLSQTNFGKLRLDYAAPSQIKIIANGETLRHEDGQTQEVNEYPIDSTPASFLLRHTIDFSTNLKVKKMETKGEDIYLTLSRPGDDGVTLVLVFVTRPMLRLQGWTVVDAQANQTQVTLKDVEIGIPLEENLFKF